MINTFTQAQKLMFLSLAKKYDPDVYEIVSRGNSETIEIHDEKELEEIELFSAKIVSLVGNDFPEVDGKDRDINDDAIAVAFLSSRIIAEFQRSRSNDPK